MIRFRCLPILMLLAQPGAAQEYPLFSSDHVLEITLELPLQTIVRQARDEPVVEGVLRFRDRHGVDISIDMNMTTRGRSRLEYCRFPPLKLNIRTGQARGTIFEGQNKLKIVTHCRNGDVHARYLRQEFGIYKAYDVLTPYSFRTRWIRVTYKDSENARAADTRDAFFIESSRELEQRLGRQRTELNRVPVKRLAPAESGKYALFQYLIANTDWSMVKGPGEEGCCHNGKVLFEPGSSKDWVVVPYDFDQAGLIHSKYSIPAAALGIRSVRQRLYRGRCRHNQQLDAAITLFNERREQMMPYLAPVSLPQKLRDKTLRYIDAFYETVNDPERKQRQLISACVGS